MEADSVTTTVVTPVTPVTPFVPLPNQYFAPGCQTCSYLNIIVPYIRENTRLARENERLNALVLSLSETIATMSSNDRKRKHKRKHKRAKKDDSEM
jgi:hypothetical protein